MIRTYSEVGIGNGSLLSTEYEYGHRELRVSWFAWPEHISGYYIRIWVWRRVMIISTDNGVEIQHKDKRRFKLVLGMKGQV
jgi:hypothetical protein